MLQLICKNQSPSFVKTNKYLAGLTKGKKKNTKVSNIERKKVIC